MDRGLQDEGQKCRRHLCPSHRCKAARQRSGARRRGSRGPRRPWRWWSQQTRRRRPSASSAAVSFTAPRAVLAAVGFTSLRATSAAAAAAAAAAAEASTAAAAAFSADAGVRTPWRLGTIVCLFPLRPVRTLICRGPNETSLVVEHVSPSESVHCPAKRSTCQLFYEFFWRFASSSGGDYEQQMPAPPAPIGPPVPSDLSWNSSIDQAVMT